MWAVQPICSPQRTHSSTILQSGFVSSGPVARPSPSHAPRMYGGTNKSSCTTSKSTRLARQPLRSQRAVLQDARYVGMSIVMIEPPSTFRPSESPVGNFPETFNDNRCEEFTVYESPFTGTTRYISSLPRPRLRTVRGVDVGERRRSPTSTSSTALMVPSAMMTLVPLPWHLPNPQAADTMTRLYPARNAALMSSTTCCCSGRSSSVDMAYFRLARASASTLAASLLLSSSPNALPMRLSQFACR